MSGADWGREGLAGLGVSLGFALVFGLAEAWKRLGRPDPEWTRKLVHLGCGLIACAFPWIFRERLSVVALSGAFFALLLLARWKRLLPSVQGVDRESWGELLFPLGVAALAWLAWNRRELFLAPMLTLSVADALAALVGKAYGSSGFEVDLGQRKSLQGSAAFFAAAFLANLLPLLWLGPQPWPAALLTSLQMAWLVTCFEAISLSGLDNLILPLGGWYLLNQLSGASAGWMAIQLAAQAGLSLMALGLALRYRFLSFSGMLAAQLYLYAAFAYGGPEWVPGPLAGMITAAFLLRREAKEGQSRAQVLSVYHTSLAPLALLLLNNASRVFGGPLARPEWWPWLAPLHAGLLAASLGLSLWIDGSRSPWRVAAPFLACALAAAWAQKFGAAQLGLLVAAGLLQGGLCLALLGFSPARDTNAALRRLSAAGMASGALLAFLMLRIHAWR